MPHVTFIHGISNKPAADALLAIWRGALIDNDLDLGAQGVSSSMVYWADLLYPAPLAEARFEAADTRLQPEELPDIGMLWVVNAENDEARLIKSLAQRIGYEELGSNNPEIAPPRELSPEEFEVLKPTAPAEVLERVPIPWFLKRRLMKVFLRDVHHYLFDVEFSPRPGATHKIRTEIRRRTIQALTAGDEKEGPHVVVAHSLGTLIAYDCLKRVAECPSIDGLLTIGSPLGLDEVQDRLRPEWSRDDGFPEKLGGRWVNVFDRLDPVAGFDPKLANDYKKRRVTGIDDIHEPSYGTWRHSIVKYLKGVQLRQALAELVDL